MKRNILYILCILSLVASLLNACKKEAKNDLSGLSTKESMQTLPAETSTEAIKQEVTTEAPTKAASTVPVVKEDKKYHRANITAIYPSFSQISGNEDKINQKIEKNISSFIHALGLDEQKDSLQLTYSILSVDNKRIAIQYDGSYTKDGIKKHLFLTNTIDILSGKDISLPQVADISTLADYILSDEVELIAVDSKVWNAFYEQRNAIDKEQYIRILESADFPLATGTDGRVISLPQSFSYSKNGDIYFTLPVEYTDTGYIMVKFTPDTK